MKLFEYFRSSTSYRVRIALNLKQLRYETHAIDLLHNEQNAGDFLGRNPFAGVPMLEADGRDRAQSMAILEWLDEAYPQYPLLPEKIEQRFTTRELAYAIATELHAPLNLPVLRYLKRELHQDQGAINRWYRHWLGKTLNPVERRLEQLGSADFLFDKPGLFEAVLLPQLNNARRFDFDLSAMPHMVRIEQACLNLPEFQDAYPAEQAIHS